MSNYVAHHKTCRTGGSKLLLTKISVWFVIQQLGFLVHSLVSMIKKKICNIRLNHLQFNSCINTSLSSTHQWVCISEPIRLPGNRDVYNALRTYLVPCDQLRNYKCYRLIV